MSSILLQLNSSADLVAYPQRWLPLLINIVLTIIVEIMDEIHCMEQFFIKLQTMYSFVSQISFFIICDTIFDNDYSNHIKNEQSDNMDKNVIIGLTTILFYNVFSYFVTKLKEIWVGNRIILFQGSPTYGNYFRGLCKIFLEWLKAIVVVICLREQGIQYHPKFSYGIITFSYYVCTEKIFREVFPPVLEIVNLSCLESLEHLYVPLVLNSYSVLIGVTIGVYKLISSFSLIALLSMYFIIYLRIKDLYYNHWVPYIAEKAAYKSFRVATNQDIQDWADICAICLSTMSRARITPCNHLFHPHCLKQCLRISFYCPLCKRHFMGNHIEMK